MIEVIIIALLVAKIKGYNLKPLFKSWTIYPILGFELIYIFVQATIFLGDYSLVKYAAIIKTIYLYLYLIPVLKYKKYYSAIVGSICMVVGSTLNNIAIKANNGTMPVFPKISYWTGYVKEDSFTKIQDIHVLGDSTTRLKFLTDVIDIGYSIISIGDIFIRGFAFIIIYNVIVYLNREKKINNA